MKKAKRTKSNERGSALLMTLGILSLVLLLGMAFAFTARSGRQLARINADNIQSRLVAESGLNATLANLRGPSTGAYYAHGLNKTKRGYGTSANDFQFGLVAWGTDTSAEDANSFAKILCKRSAYVDKFLNDIDDDDLPKGFVTVTDGSSSSAKVIGRYGILFMEESGKLDLNAIISPTGSAPFVRNEPATWTSGDRTYGRNFFDKNERDSDEFYYNIVGSSTGELTYDPCDSLSYSSPNTLRIGLAMNELRLTDSDYYTALPTSNGQKVPWLSYSHLLNENDVSFGNTSNNDIFTYTFFSGEEPEAYWDGTNERARFDLTGYEWGDGTYYSSNKPDPEGSWQDSTGGFTYAQTLVEALTSTSERPTFWKASHSGSSRSIDDVNDVPEPAAASTTFGIPYLYGKTQIAANLVDYSDDDDYATWDMTTGDIQDLFNVNAALPDGPEYFGNERVAYFNEVGFYTSATSAFDTANGVDEFELSLNPVVELVNIFPSNVDGGDLLLRIDGTITVSVNGMPVEVKPPATSALHSSYHVSADGSFTLVLDGEYGDANNVGFQSIALANPVLDSRTVGPRQGFVPGGEVGTPTRVVYTITINAVTMLSQDGTTDGHQFDFAQWKAAATTGVEIFQTAVNWENDANFDGSASLEAVDPRCNYLSNSTENLWQWRQSGGQSWSATSDMMTLLENNSCFVDQDGTGADLEDDVDFTSDTKTYSTAFIRNAPMEGLWELGLIHRGQPGRTLDLTKLGDGGDAAILDQVKIGPAKFSRGKYNANAFNPAVLALLMKGIGDAQALDDIIDGDFDFDSTDVDPDDFTDTAPSSSRGAFVAKIADLIDAADDDLSREAYIGRTANLLSTRYETFTIAVVGQSLRQLDEISTDADFNAIKATLHKPTKYTVGSDARYCDILGTQVILAHVVRDTWHNTCRIVQMQYL